MIVVTTLARITLLPHLRIAHHALVALFDIFQREQPPLHLLPSSIFASSSPPPRYNGLTFLDALINQCHKVYSKFQTNLQTNPSHLPKYIERPKEDQIPHKTSLLFCSNTLHIPLSHLKATPRIRVDPEIKRKLIHFAKESFTTVITTTTHFVNIIPALPSDSSQITPLVSEVDLQLFESLKQLRQVCEAFLHDLWGFFVDVTFGITVAQKPSFQTIILDDPSFPDFIVNSIKLNNNNIRMSMLIAITNILIHFPRMKVTFMTANLVGRMFETIDFVSRPLSEPRYHLYLTKFIACMSDPIGVTDDARFEQCAVIRVSVFEPAKQFIKKILHYSDKLTLEESIKFHFDNHLCWIHNNIKNLELRSDEHSADIVSELVKWEARTMVQMESERYFDYFFQTILHRTREWRRFERERQKRREMVLREEGWDDAFELRVVGIERDTRPSIFDKVRRFRVELALNTDEPF
ncbi:hypothetical protein BLNAU_14261 [Blattamonas nauphoetae]|uniref:Uncharacterized protein n=1 Tax=Blattamonas nauphoetae TaxID=2049346 RepID=A0ABQ9XEE9_9EUKA|nr:hypothetical protein BLNAU_14261 [Blattamonas nauphoetae]